MSQGHRTGVRVKREMMPIRPQGRPCKSCESPLRSQIELAIVRGCKYRAIERLIPGWALEAGLEPDECRISNQAIGNHARDCVPEILIQCADNMAKRDELSAASVYEQMGILMIEATEALEKAKQSPKLMDLNMALEQFRKAIELLARIYGQIGADIEVKLVESPQWNDLQHAIFDTLTRYDREEKERLCGNNRPVLPMLFAALKHGAEIVQTAA